VIVFDVTHRCTSRCVGCAFREPEEGELPVEQWAALAGEARQLGFREIVLTGGEPLAHPEIARLLPALAEQLPVSLMTNGLALRRHAALVRAHASGVFVSLDGATDDTYQRVRGVRGLAAVREGVRALDGVYRHARVTVWAENVDQLPEIVRMAREDGFSEMSFLACDTTSGGFGERGDERGTPPRPDQIDALRRFFAGMRGDRFVAMSDYAIERLLRLSAGERETARCLAPWTSGVVDPVGNWRHCYFLPTGATTADGLRGAMRKSRPERRALRLETEPACASCVCWRG
jgi:MoaA/NifB/PqqE/SkfB family radical SAM enzyme